MICQKCNIRYESGKFCKKCGSALSEEAVSAFTEGTSVNVVSAEDSVQAASDSAIPVEGFAQAASDGAINAEDSAQATSDSVINTEAPIKATLLASPSSVKPVAPAENPVLPQASKKKKKWVLPVVILLFLLVLTIGGSLYYLGHSRWGGGNYTSDKKPDEISALSLFAEAVEGEDINLKLKYADLNGFLKQRAEAARLSLAGIFQVDSAYYDGSTRKVVLDISSPLGETSLLMMPEIKSVGKVWRFSLQSPALGAWQIPLPSALLGHFPKEWQIDLTPAFFADIQSVELQANALEIKGKIKTEELKSFFSGLRESVDPFLVQYLTKQKEVKLPGYLEMLAFAEKSEWKELLISWSTDIQDVPNWLTLLPENTLQKYFEFAELLMGEEDISQLKSRKTKILKEKSETLEAFNEYKERTLTAQLKTDAAILFDRLYQYHQDRGVPAYYLASKGKLYSQVLQEYIGTYKIRPDSDIRWDAYELYAYGQEPVIGINVGEEFWYVKDKDKNTLLKKPKAEFLQGITYSPEQLNGDLLLRRGNADRSAIARVVSTSLDTQQREDIFIQYLASDGNFAFLIASPDYNRQKVEQYFLQRINGQWQIMRKFFETQSIRTEMANEIASQNFNVCILPPYETKDFQRNYLSSYDLSHYEWNYYYETGYDKTVNYYSSIGNNTYITFDADSKFLYVNDNRMYIARTEKVADYFQYLIPHSSYKNYRPTFLFYQD